jgi:5-methylcytosine-specific restriction endonuclease McrA
MLDGSVLVLNRLFQPIHVTSVKRAFTLLYQGAARAVDAEYRQFDFESWSQLSSAVSESIGTQQRRIRIPRVILLNSYDQSPRSRIRFSRLNVYARDQNTCQYCGKVFPRHELNLDHVAPRSKGGATSWENVVCSCVPCNLKKGGRTPEEAKMPLVRKPTRPRWTPFFRTPTGRKTYREWIPFLSLADASYWSAELHEE